MDSIEKYFDIAFSAPDGIKKLREIILALAMQGKLVPQNPKDKPASELIKEMRIEREKLVKADKIRNQKPLPLIAEKEIPYQIPQSWQWVRLTDIGEWKAGSTPNRSNSAYYGGKIPWVKSGEVKIGFIENTEETVTELAMKDCSLKINPIGSVLVAMYGANIGEVGILGIEATTNQAVCACELLSGVSNKFLLHFISYQKSAFIKQGAGAAQPNISREKIIATPFALPPREEQQRILNKIDSLFKVCDELEKLRLDKEHKRLDVHTGAINALLKATEKNDFNKAWQFISKNFSELYSVKENVDELRKAILQLAVMGKLVPQSYNDKPASELLKEIHTERENLVKSGKIKKQKPLPVITDKEIPFRIPDSWTWVRLGEIMQFINGDRGKNYPSKDKLSLTGIPFISAVNLSNGTVSQENLLCVSETQFQKLGSGKLKKNDLVFCIRGSLGKKAIYPFEIGAIASSLVILRQYHNEDNFLHFVDLYMSSPLLFNEIRKYDNGTAQPNLSANNFMRFLIPLPPREEQLRIVSKIRSLILLCDELDNKIKGIELLNNSLLSAVMVQL